MSKRTTDRPTLISLSIAAKRLGISGGLFVKELAGSKVPIVWIGDKRFVKAADLDRFIASIGRSAS